MVFNKRYKKAKKTVKSKKVLPQLNGLGEMQNIYQPALAQTSVSDEVPMLDHQDSNTADNSTSLKKGVVVPESPLKTDINNGKYNSHQQDLEAKTKEKSCLDLSTPNTSCSLGQNVINCPTTPDNPIAPEKMFSPNTVNEIRSTIRTLFPNGPPKPPSVIPVKRHKKGDPYIVGCKERKRVPESKSLKFFTGDNYGITNTTNAFDDEDASLHTPAKRSRITYNGKLSKSKFNPQSDEIAARLKINDKVDELLQKSHVKESCSFMSKPYSPRPAFSPIPSTSKDNETILKNEKHFNESLNFRNNNLAISDDEELPIVMLTKGKQKKKHVSLIQNENLNTINIPSPIVINDIVSQINSDTYLKKIDFNAIFSTKKSPKTEDFTEPNRSISPIIIDDKNDDENVIEDETKVDKSSKTIDFIEINDEYSSITYEEKYGMPKAEYVVNVDDVLAEYEAYKKKRANNNKSILTIVDPITLEASHSERNTKTARQITSKAATNNNTIDLVTPHAVLNEAKSVGVFNVVPSTFTTNNNTVNLISSNTALNEAKSDEVCKRVPSTSTTNNTVDLVTPQTVWNEAKTDEFCKEAPSMSPTVIDIPDVTKCAVNVPDENNKATTSFSWKDDVEIVSETLPVRPFNTSSNNDVQIVECDFSSRPSSNTRNRRDEALLSDLKMFFAMVDHTMSFYKPKKRTTKKRKTTRKTTMTVRTRCQNEAPSMNGHPPMNAQPPMNGQTPTNGQPPTNGQTPTNGQPPTNGQTPTNGQPPANGQTPTNSQPAADGERYLGDCPICLENLSINSVASTTCGHVFCLDCLKKSLKSSGKQCPSCRRVLKGKGYHQIFL